MFPEKLYESSCDSPLTSATVEQVPVDIIHDCFWLKDDALACLHHDQRSDKVVKYQICGENRGE